MTSAFTFNKPTESSSKSNSSPFTFNSISSNNTSTTTTASNPFKFNLPTSSTTTSTTDSKESKPLFSFNTNKNEGSSSTPLSFNSKPALSTPSPSTFSSFVFKTPTDKKTTESKIPTFTFTKPEDNKTTTEKKTETSNISTPAFKPFVFSFGQKMDSSKKSEGQDQDEAKTLPKPNFSFGVHPPSKSEIAAAHANATPSTTTTTTTTTTAGAGNDETEEDNEQLQLTTGAGEEDDDVLYEIKAKIHHYSIKDKKYVSRGVGLLKVNKNKKNGKVRLLARMDNGTVFLNVNLFKEMEITEPVNANQFTFNAMDMIDNELKLVKFVVRVGKKDTAKELYQVLMENKDN